jgi:hypothetical protein
MQKTANPSSMFFEVPAFRTNFIIVYFCFVVPVVLLTLFDLTLISDYSYIHGCLS